ncbi:IS21-like element helper ATPase IstB [Methanoplanus endosymbiosus]|uniref:IS21-like element helper ATPase IstB n=1 Tax=Methanoplanus endosymbiosus TaxID=33865 RepID=A0A9E7TLE3_9EURY|nr:IS21-like element helper ATPase IstB [Methanoplanus endosymbiosus]UUX92251.1 IS21-like element helper ATPase IstB [Methanoplanus endosymbiosus]
MLHEETISKLYEMRLSNMAQNFRNQMEDNSYASMSFEDRFGILVDLEWHRRKDNRLTQLIRKAEYVYPQACIEDINYSPSRHLDKGQITRLSSCSYIRERNNVIILGATGTGKSYLACALGMAANRSSYPVKYIRLPELFAELAIARSEGNYREIIKGYKKMKLLILDEWLLTKISETEAIDLLEIMEARYMKASTIVCSQFEVGGWYQKISNATIADAICDRIVHNTYTITLKGDSMRKINGRNEVDSTSIDP